MNLGTVDYSSTVPPDGYRCTTCGAHGCKLWREYNTCADYTELVCCDCAGKSQSEDVSDIDADGKRGARLFTYTRRQRREAARWGLRGRRGARSIPRSAMAGGTDQIGWRVPAVPTEEGDTYWGYTSVPEPGVQWWRLLPTRAA